MVSYKVYVSGNSVEIYEYEHISASFEPETTSQQSQHENILSGERYANTNTKEKRRKQTLRENAMNLKRMARHYFQAQSLFITLTFAKDIDLDKADRKVKYMFKKMREKMGDTQYIGVRERTKKGRIHYHFIVYNEYMVHYMYNNIPKATRRGKYTIKHAKHKEYEREFSQDFWKHGYVDIKMIDFVDNVGAYIAKYMMKNEVHQMEWLEKRRLILRSEKIKKIEPVNEDWFRCHKNIDETMKLIRSIAEEDIKDNRERKRVFTNGYTNEINGKVTYYEIHKSRIDYKILEKLQN